MALLPTEEEVLDRKRVWIGVCAVAALGCVLCVAFAYSGAYPLAVDHGPGSIVHFVRHTMAARSTHPSAERVAVPELQSRKNLVTGAGHYDKMCASCHGAPGAKPSEMARGLDPRPPELVELDADEDPAELFLVSRRGLEVVGEPAWGATHDDAATWTIVALLKQLPDLSAREYAQLVETANTDSHHHKEGAHDHHDHGH
jgi:mono/diheme cytochrome c family protein